MSNVVQFPTSTNSDPHDVLQDCLQVMHPVQLIQVSEFAVANLEHLLMEHEHSTEDRTRIRALRDYAVASVVAAVRSPEVLTPNELTQATSIKLHEAVPELKDLGSFALPVVTFNLMSSVVELKKTLPESSCEH